MIQAYRRAIKFDKRWSVPWFNLGLLFADSTSRINLLAAALESHA